MSETITETDVSFLEQIVTSSQMADEWCCESIYPTDCSREAVYRVTWAGDTGSPVPDTCPSKVMLMCLPCFEHYTSKDGFTWCRRCDDVGVKSHIRIVFSEPVRKTA